MSSSENILAAAETKKSNAEIIPASYMNDADTDLDFLHRNLQFKLTIGSPDDPLETEADQMADQIMRMPETAVVQRKCNACEEEERVSRKPLYHFIQKKCAHCEEEERISKKPLIDFIQKKCAECEAEEEEQQLQRKGSGIAEASGSIASRIQNSRGTGNTLDPETGSFMERGFGVDFSSIKLHTDSTAVQLSSALNAQAFTIGNDIYFNSGKYDPHSASGKHLLAHELTHTIQQGAAIRTKTIQRKKDQGADNAAIKYDEVIPINQYNWNQFDFYRLNPFAYLGITPYNNPNAFANETFRLQQAILKAAMPDELDHLPLAANGVFGMTTILHLVKLAAEASGDREIFKLMLSYGLNTRILNQFIKVYNKNIDVVPLGSRTFNRHGYFELINSNTTFVLTVGDENEAVRILQEVLLTLRYDVGETGMDGKFTEATKKALRSFQIENGVPEAEADGVLGFKTLRLLDKRMSVAAKDYTISTGHGNVLLFKVPVTDFYTPEQMLLKSISSIFQISEKQAEQLISTSDSENKWGWLQNSFKGITQTDVNRGYTYIGVPVTDYEKILTIFKSTIPAAGEPIEPKIKKEILDLEPYNKIYRLNKELSELRLQLAKLLPHVVNPVVGVSKVGPGAELMAQIDAKEKELAEEYRKLGLDPVQFAAKTAEFKNTFASYAVKIAFQMLDENERLASLEMIRYKKSGDPDSLSQGEAIKKVFTRLDELWTRAEKEWWQGISVDQGAAVDEITSYTTFNNFLKEKKGMRARRIGSRGDYDYIEPVDNYLPAYQRSQFKERTGNSYFIKAYDSNHEAYEFLSSTAQEYPVLAYPKLKIKENIKKYKELSASAIEENLYSTAESVKENIKKTRLALDESPMNVFKLKPVIERAKIQLGIFPDTFQNSLVEDALKEYEDAEFWKNIGMAALGIGLGLLALVSGPVGWAALAGGIIVGGIDAYQTYQDITFRREAANTAFDPSKALSDVEPGYFWFYVSLVFVGLDVFQGLKAIAEVAKAAKATEEGLALATKMTEALKKDRDAIEALIKQGGPDTAKLAEQLEKINHALSNIDPDKLAKQLNIIKQLHDIPQAVIRLSVSLDNPEVLKAFELMGSLVKKSGLSDDAYKSILRFYAGVGNDFAAEMPEIMRLAGNMDWTGKPALLEELLTNPRSQKVMLDLGENQDKMFKLWEEFGALKAAGKATNFTDFLKEKGFVVELGKSRSIVSELGADFFKLPLVTRNQEILRTIEPELAQALLDKTLPKNIEAALTRILQTDLLGQTTDLVRAQERMKVTLRLLGAALETPAEYQQLMRLLKSAESRLAVFEKATGLPGYEEFSALLTKYSKELADNPAAMEDFLKIGPFTDPDTFDWLLKNNEIRKLLANNPDLVRILKKCASPCFPMNASPGDITRILAVLNANKGKIDYAKLNEYMYLNRPRGAKPNADELLKWETAIKKLETDFTGTMSGVKLPDVGDINIPPNFRPGARAELIDATGKLTNLIKKGMSPKQLEDILAQAQNFNIDPKEFMTTLARANAVLGSKKTLENIGGIINGLTSTKRVKFDTAYYFLKKIGDFQQGGKAADMVERIFAVFDLDEITKLRISKGSQESAELMKASGEASLATIDVFDTLVSKINGSSEDIIALAYRAGSNGEENLLRLASVVKNMPGTGHSVSSIITKIDEAKKFAEEIASAGDAMGDKIWGIQRGSNKKYEVEKMFQKEGKFSGTDAISHVKKQSEEIATGLLDSSGSINLARWENFKTAINDTDLPTIIKNGLIGEMWDKINIRAYRKIYGNDNVIQQVTIRIKGTSIEAIVDCVIKDNGKYLFKEFKTGLAELSENQKKVYEKMGLGLVDELEFTGANASKVWPDASLFAVGEVKIVRAP